jgi:hypothetical protein
MLVSACGSFTCTTVLHYSLKQHGWLNTSVPDAQHVLMPCEMQAAYNNTSEIELEGGDVPETRTSATSLYSIGIKVAK